MNPDARRAYTAAARTILGAFESEGPFPGQEVTPPLLAEAIDQCIEVLGTPEAARGLSADELDEVGTHALNCVSDLALWAAHLRLAAERAAVENLGLEFAEGLAACDARINVIEPVVNALARRANAMHDPQRLVPLARLARDLIVHVTEEARSEAAGDNAWRILNFNYAIIATRTQRPALMEEAFDLLEANLPEECPSFFDEGVRESQKPVYGPHVAESLRRRLAKWTVRH